MDFRLSEEQEMLRSMVTRYLAENYSFEQRRKRLKESGGFDPLIWTALSTELGILGATLPEAAGGLGGGAVENMIISEALGASLVTEPYLETIILGGGLLKAAGGETADTLLHGVGDGTIRLALAANEVSGRLALHDVCTTASYVDGGWVLTGEKPVVWAAPVVTHLLVTARTAHGRYDREGISLFLVPVDHPGVDIRPFRLIDDRPAGDVRFENVLLDSSALLGRQDEAFALVERAMDEATAALCADAVGGMRRLLDATVEYTKQRKQFGQPLSSFQALQHRMVDMYMALEQSVSAVYLATLNLDADDAARKKAVSAAKVTIGRNGRMIGQNAVQLHGAMGIADELAVSHHFKRITVIEHAFGSLDYHLERYETVAA